MKNSKTAALVRHWGLITLGAVVYAVGFNWFYRPNAIAFGGVTGTAQILNALFPVLPVGATALALNIPLFLLGWRFLGGKVLLSSLYAMAVSSLAIDGLDAFVQFQPTDPMLAAIFGGVFLGGSLGLVFLAGATTGGTDLLARLLKLKLPWLPMGKVLLGVDLAVIVCAAAVFGELNAALYGLASLYISSLVLDWVLYGTDQSRLAYIISDRSQEITEHITKVLDRGVTILHGRGAWSGLEKEVLLVAFRQREIVPLKAAVKELDPKAFVIVCPAHEVLGEGFRPHTSEQI